MAVIPVQYQQPPVMTTNTVILQPFAFPNADAPYYVVPMSPVLQQRAPAQVRTIFSADRTTVRQKSGGDVHATVWSAPMQSTQLARVVKPAAKPGKTENAGSSKMATIHPPM